VDRECHSLIVALFLLALGGCVMPEQRCELPEPRLLGRDVTAYMAPREPSDAAPAAPLPAEAPGELTLRQALGLALMGNPALAASSWSVRAAEARALQVSLRPNPELETEVENVGGQGATHGVGAAETTLALSQLVELGGKRASRVRVAQLEGTLAGWDYEAARLDALAETAKAFVRVLAAQERVALEEELVSLAERGHQTVMEKLKSGKVSAVEGDKARVELATSRIELAKARRELAARRKQLAATWGGAAPAFDRAVGQLDATPQIPSAEQLASCLAQNPDLARWAVEMQQREARLALERANRKPDLTFSGGVRYSNESNEGSFVVGVAVPLPLFDRNQGGIREARAEVARAREERRAAEAKLHADLAEAYEALASAHDEATGLRADVLPGAQRAFDAAQEGYRQGKFGYLEVLDAQRTLFEARQKLIEALASYHQAVADVERLIGQSLESVTKESK